MIASCFTNLISLLAIGTSRVEGLAEGRSNRPALPGAATVSATSLVNSALVTKAGVAAATLATTVATTVAASLATLPSTVAAQPVTILSFEEAREASGHAEPFSSIFATARSTGSRPATARPLTIAPHTSAAPTIQSVPQSVPHSVPHSVPLSVPLSVPHSVSQSVPQSIPHSAPTTSLSFVGTIGTASDAHPSPALISAPVLSLAGQSSVPEIEYENPLVLTGTQALHTRQLVPEEVQVPAASPALWRVSDQDTTIYLFGTVHVLPEGLDWFNGTVRAAFEASRELVTEIIETPEDITATQHFILREGTLPADQSLRDMFDPKQRAQYEAMMRKLGLPVNALDQYQPWFAAISLSSIQFEKLGLSPDHGVEKTLVRNKALHMRHIALETMIEQMQIFDGLPRAAQIAFLIDPNNGDGDGNVKEALDHMVNVWRNGNSEKLAELVNVGIAHPDLAHRLLHRRNQAWARWIDHRLESPGTVFIAVGAGHLAGEKSVQEYLNDYGENVIRIQ